MGRIWDKWKVLDLCWSNIGRMRNIWLILVEYLGNGFYWSNIWRTLAKPQTGFLFLRITQIRPRQHSKNEQQPCWIANRIPQASRKFLDYEISQASPKNLAAQNVQWKQQKDGYLDNPFPLVFDQSASRPPYATLQKPSRLFFRQQGDVVIWPPWLWCSIGTELTQYLLSRD